ncbi:Detected protein of unknown function [Hibiscus syriacus]|uniref:Retrotransposon gag domain-containing protein n=1 Tax=Hibiscus syriacus TaxID=106335 RepID=A0A6A2XCP6_HIBSY|nr:Detected protein of unknown function [Hibiscus syriacus]
MEEKIKQLEDQMNVVKGDQDYMKSMRGTQSSPELGYGENDQLLIHCFQESLSGSAIRWYNQLSQSNIKTWKDLSKSFLEQYKHINDTLKTSYFGHLVPITSGSFSDLVMAGEMIESIVKQGKIKDGEASRKPPMQERDEEINNINHASKGVTISKSKSTAAVPSGTSKQDFREPRREKKHFDPIPMTYKELYHQLLDIHVVSPYPVEPMKPPYPKWYDENAHCEYHGGVLGHTIENRYTFKRVIQKMRNQNWINFNNLGASKMKDTRLASAFKERWWLLNLAVRSYTLTDMTYLQILESISDRLAQKNLLKNYERLRPMKGSHFSKDLRVRLRSAPSSKAHHLQYSLSREGLSAKVPRVQLQLASRAHHLQHNSRLEVLSVTKRPSSLTSLSSKAYHLQHNLSIEGLYANTRPLSSTTLSSTARHLQHSLSREGLSAKDPRVRLYSASRAYHLQHNSRLEGLSVTKDLRVIRVICHQRPSSSTTLSSKAYHLQHNLSLEGLSANQRPSSSTTLSSKARHLHHSLSREGISAKDPRVRLHLTSRAYHLQHNSRLEGLSVTKRPSSSSTLSSQAYHLQHNLTQGKKGYLSIKLSSSIPFSSMTPQSHFCPAAIKLNPRKAICQRRPFEFDFIQLKGLLTTWWSQGTTFQLNFQAKKKTEVDYNSAIRRNSVKQQPTAFPKISEQPVHLGARNGQNQAIKTVRQPHRGGRAKQSNTVPTVNTERASTIVNRGGGIHRFKEHLAGRKGQGLICEQVPQEVRALTQDSLNGVLGEVTRGSRGRKRLRDQSLMAKRCFLYDIGVDLDAVNSVCFQPMIDAIVSGGSGTVPPSYEGLRGWILKNVIEEVIEEVGAENVVQVITSCDEQYFLTGKRFVYNRCVVLNMMRRFTGGNNIAMVSSQDWLECPYAKKPGGLAMSDIVRNRSFWNSCILIARITHPFLQVLEIVGSKKRVAMGYIYAGIYRAKETIKKKLVKKDEYMVNGGLYTGGGCPNLQQLAIRVLGQTCSSIGCRPNKISIEEIHDTRNILERQRLSDLVFVQYNLYLRQMVLRNQEKHAVNPLSFNNKDILEDWIANEVYPEYYESSDWMSLDPPVDNRTPLAPPGEETEDFLGRGLTDLDIFNGLKGVKEEI